MFRRFTNRENLPFPERFPLTEPVRARLGEMALLYRGWGRHDTKRSFLRRYPKLSEFDREMVDQTGFSGGYRVDDDLDVLTPEFQEYEADILADTVRQVAGDRYWKDIDVLVIASLSFQPENTELVREKLRRQGLNVETILFYGQACNGLIAGITDSCRRPEMAGKRVVVAGLENLSGGQMDYSDVKLAWTFGNGISTVAFIPGVDIINIVGKTVVERDEKGVIGLPPSYGLPNPKRRLPPLPWYEVKPNAKNHFVTSSYGVCMAMFPSENKAFMNGRETFMYFARRVPPVVTDVLQEYWQKHFAKYGELGPGLAHQASKPVLTGLQNKLDKNADEAGFPRPVFPWMMEPTGFNNVSSATAGIAFTEMVRQGLIVPGRPFPVMGYGIGSVIEGDVLIVPTRSGLR